MKKRERVEPKGNPSVPVPTIMHVNEPDESGKLFRGVIPTDGVVQDVILDIGKMNKESARIRVIVTNGDVDNSVGFRVEKGRNEYPVPLRVKRGSVFVLMVEDQEGLVVGDVSLGFVIVPKPTEYREPKP
jgi:hypothetical protein